MKQLGEDAKPMTFIKAKAAMTGHTFYCGYRCGWTGSAWEVMCLRHSSKGWRLKCPQCGWFTEMCMIGAKRKTKL